MNIEEMLSEFNKSAGGSRELILGILDLIAAGKVPGAAEVQQLDAQITDLQNRYADIRAAAAAEISAEEMPADGAAAADYVQAVQNSAVAVRRRQLQELRAVLISFASVQAREEVYAAALQQYQQRARDLAASIDANDAALEELEQESAGPRAFLDTLRCEDINSDEALDLLDQVAEYYPRRVQNGLTLGQYVLAADDGAVAGSAGVEASSASTESDMASAGADSGTEQPTAAISDAGPDSGTENLISADTQDAAEVALAQSESRADDETTVSSQGSDDNGTATQPQSSDDDRTAAQSSETSFAQIVAASGVLVDEMEMPALSGEDSPNAHKKISASIFCNEVKKGNKASIKKVVQALRERTVISIGYLNVMKNMSVTSLATTMTFLYNHGYVRRYRLDLVHEVYCASPRLKKAMTYREAAKELGLPQMALETWVDPEDIDKCKVINGVLWDRLFLGTINTYKKHKITMASTHEKRLANSALIIMKAQTERKIKDRSVVDISACWNNTEECDAFLQMLQDAQDKTGHIVQMIIGSYDKERAMILAGLISEHAPLHSDKILVYSEMDGEYYTYPDGMPATEYDDPDGKTRTAVPQSATTQAPASESTAAQVSTSSLSAITEAAASSMPATTQTTSQPSATTSAVANAAASAMAVPEDITVSAEPVHDAAAMTPDDLLLQAGEPAADAAPAPETATTESTTESKTAEPVTSPNAQAAESKDAAYHYATKSDVDSMLETVASFLTEDRMYAASAYAKCCALQSPDAAAFYKRLAYALDDPMERCSYSADVVFSLIESEQGLEGALVLSAAIRTFYSNQVGYDYNLGSYYGGIKDYALLKTYTELGKVLYHLEEFKDAQHKGMDAYADYHAASASDIEARLQGLQQEAGEFYDNYVLTKRPDSSKNKRFADTKKLMLNERNELCQYIHMIAEGDTSATTRDMAIEYLQEHFYRKGVEISPDTIDEDRISEYVDSYWAQAGTQMAKRQRETLKGDRRTNLVNQTQRTVALVARWCEQVGRLGNHSEDAGRKAYDQIRDRLLLHIDDAMGAMRRDCGKTGMDRTDLAGRHVLIYTLHELRTCLDGSREEGVRRYYYLPFLLTNDVMLSENYLPDLDTHASTMVSLLPTTRIRHHIEQMRTLTPDYADTLQQIREGVDNYGAARLIVQYLERSGAEEQRKEQLAALQEDANYAKERADKAHDEFIGNLELAQGYGQFDNSEENKKERIQQTVEEWGLWAEETSNYGFYQWIMDTYLAEIREMAKVREKGLREELEAFRTSKTPRLSLDDKARRIERIEEMLDDQNYTVAEDLLGRGGEPDEYNALWEEDYLDHFLKNYDDYYTPVSSHQRSFASAFNKAHNKDQKAARTLIENWLPEGGRFGEERLRNLLNGLGFRRLSVESRPMLEGRHEQYFVKITRAQDGHRDSYTHPIAAFGSGAIADGFRVVCLNCVYTPDALIEVLRQIGNARHTLVLFNHAMSKPERRRLAHKSKYALEDKMFGVIDRTVIMYLFKNYNATTVNRMLMALIAPFAYYQPYVWQSASPMPPELFMGRKNELEEIKSLTGVNIVYGGRQLGKSALLRKAQEDIDHDENGNRAVLIDIKKCNYREAASVVAQELADRGILEQGFDTDDWSRLAREIKRRITSTQDPIPYLLLLLDEADDFIESCGGEVNYRPFDALKDIQGTGRFKFVIAGLHNIVRFKRGALGNNSVLTQLRAETIVPFSYAEARELLEYPLWYLGFRFTRENEYLISLILATTNYFPGLIQLYCAKLIKVLHSKDCMIYNETSSPQYMVTESHIKKVLSDPDFTKEIRDKFFITLALDEKEDNYYTLLAYLMAYQYHYKPNNSGYTAADLKKTSEDYGITKIAELDTTRLEALMEELRELNVFRNTVDDQYLFSRYSFFQMMGTRVEIEDKLCEYMGE